MNSFFFLIGIIHFLNVQRSGSSRRQEKRKGVSDRRQRFFWFDGYLNKIITPTCAKIRTKALFFHG
ncbi:MAG: hypothetical protein KAR17_00720 [Cyclobacteriaceae bacterium]|nr:hypothetical protein [Cyclobacteriaceae bacterium]